MNSEAHRSVIRNMLLLIEMGDGYNADVRFSTNCASPAPCLPPLQGLERVKQLNGSLSASSNKKNPFEAIIAVVETPANIP